MKIYAIAKIILDIAVNRILYTTFGVSIKNPINVTPFGWIQFYMALMRISGFPSIRNCALLPIATLNLNKIINLSIIIFFICRKSHIYLYIYSVDTFKLNEAKNFLFVTSKEKLQIIAWNCILVNCTCNNKHGSIQHISRQSLWM